MMAHSTGDVTSGYVQLIDDNGNPTPDFRKAAQKVADRFKELCAIEVPAGDNVVAIAQ
jgi:hypothetical protein